MALHRKLEALRSLRPDIAVVQEAAEPLDWKDELSQLAGNTSVVWVGKNPRKGLAVVGFNGVQVELDACSVDLHQYVVPVVVRGGAHFNLLAVWDFNDRGIPGRTKIPGPVRRALIDYASFCATADLVVMGDFNHSVVWDTPGSVRNMTAIIDDLHAHDLFSAYHVCRGMQFGKETDPTHYWRDRKKDKHTYHIDYCFLPNRWHQHVRHVEVGSFEDWCQKREDRPSLSDHAPLVVEVDDRYATGSLPDRAQMRSPDLGRLHSRSSRVA